MNANIHSQDAGDAVDAIGGYRRGVFVRAARGSSIDVGLFHDDQRRSVATVEAWFNPGEKVGLSKVCADGTRTWVGNVNG